MGRAIDISKAVNAREASAQQIARETLDRADRYEQIQPEAWISRCSEVELLRQAEQIDARVAAGETLALAGVPVAIKDNIDVAGLETTAACPAFAYRPDASAPVVEQLRAAGALIVGKTNLDQFATGLVGMRSPYGSLGCVYNRDYVSGGSSSGSAVLVAAGVVPVALGTDTAGSGRVPAAFNNLVGLKPTRGRWSSRGVVPACRTLDCVSALTNDVADAMRVDEVLTRFDHEDPYARRSPEARTLEALPVRMGVPFPSQRNDLGAEDTVCFGKALQRLEALGMQPVEVDVSPLLQAARLLYGGPWVAERTAAVSGLLATNSAAIHPVVRAILQSGQGISGVETFRGLYELQKLARAAEDLWEGIDLLALPTTPTIYRRAELLAEPVALNAHLGLYTNFVNLLDMSALALPAGFRDNSTGIGISLIGPAWADRQLLELALRYERSQTPSVVPELDQRSRTPTVRVAVVGAHMSGLPLHHQLAARNARLVERTQTAGCYKLYAMSAGTPTRPALVYSDADGSAIEAELYELEVEAFGSFTAEIPAPLAMGAVSLKDGAVVRGFVAEPRALAGARDITSYGSWRNYLAQSKEHPP